MGREQKRISSYEHYLKKVEIGSNSGSNGLYSISIQTIKYTKPPFRSRCLTSNRFGYPFMYNDLDRRTS